MSDIAINGVIGSEVSSQRVINQMKAIPGYKQVVIHSQGGDALEVSKLFNAMVENKVDTLIDTKALSAAGFLALAGDTVRMKSNALLMFHGPLFEFEQGGTANLDEMKEGVKALESVATSIVSTIVTKTGKSEKEVSELLKGDNWFTPKQALDAGWVHEIVESNGHVADISAFTDIPATIVAFSKTFEEKRDMSLRDVATGLSLKFEKDDKDDVVEKLVTTHIKGLDDRIVALTKEGEDSALRVKELDKKLNPEKTSHPASYVELVRKNRTLEITALFSEGKMIAEVKDDMLADYCSEEALNDALDDDANERAFQKVIAKFDKNKPVLRTGGRTGIQAIHDDSKGNDPEKGGHGLLAGIQKAHAEAN